MCENVNINVSETNETINIVATEVQEVIDINVFETTEDVTLNITEQLIQVNVNKVTAAEQIQSDWAQTDNEALDFIKNKPTIPTNTSDLINDGEDGVNPFITANDIPPVTGFVPYTGATEDVNLGAYDLTATQGTFATSGNPDTLTVTHSSGSGKALTITKGGNGEGIYVNKTSGSGNAVTIVGDLEATNLKRTGGTSSQFLKANGSVDSNTYTPTTRTISTSAPLSGGGDLSANRTLSISQATTVADGYLSSTDWNTFNNKLTASISSPENRDLLAYDSSASIWKNSSFYNRSLGGVQFFTDFDSSTSFDKLVSVTAGVAAATNRLVGNVPNQTANQIGIAQYQTGITTTGYALHITEVNSNAQQFQLGGGTWMYESYIEVDILSNSTDRFRFISGFGNVANSGAETNGAFFTYDEGGVLNGTIASPNWQCVTTVGAVRTLTTTSVAATTTWTKLRIIVNAEATEVKFYIDGILVATHTTNIPVFPNRLKVLQKLVKNLGTANRFVYCDYIFYENNLTTLR